MRVKYSTYYKLKKQNKILLGQVEALEQLIKFKTGMSSFENTLFDISRLMSTNPRALVHLTNIEEPNE